MAKKKVAPSPMEIAAVEEPKDNRPHLQSSKLDTLKSLNTLLVKETVEMRKKVDHLNSQMDDQSLVSALEESVVLTAFRSEVSFLRDEWSGCTERMLMEASRAFEMREAEKAEAERKLRSAVEESRGLLRSLDDARVALERAGKDRDEMEKTVVQALAESEAARAELDLCRGDMKMLERSLADSEEALGRARMECAAAADERMEQWKGFQVLLMEKGSLEKSLAEANQLAEDLKKEMAETVKSKEEMLEAVRSDLRKKEKEAHEACRMLKDSEEQFLRNISCLKEEADFLRMEEEAKSVKVCDLERTNELLGAELCDIKRKNEALGVEVERLFVKVTTFEEHIGLTTQRAEATSLVVSELERRKQELESMVETLVMDAGNLREEVGFLRVEEDAMCLKVSLLQKENEELHCNAEELAANLTSQVEESIEKCRGFELMIERQTKLIDGLKEQLNNAVHEKEEMEHLDSRQQHQIAGLEAEVKELNSTVAALQKLGSDRAEALAVMQSKSEYLQESLDQKIEVETGLTCQIENLQKSKDNLQQELYELSASLEKLLLEMAERDRNLHLISEDKASADKNLVNAQEKVKDLFKKLEAATNVLAGVMYMLKSIGNAIRAHDDNCDRLAAEVDIKTPEQEELQPFISELDCIRKAYKLKIDELNAIRSEACLLRDTADNAKKKSGLWAWVSSASTVVAAMSVAYAARVH